MPADSLPFDDRHASAMPRWHASSVVPRISVMASWLGFRHSDLTPPVALINRHPFRTAPAHPVRRRLRAREPLQLGDLLVWPTTPRPISPWSRPPTGAPRGAGADRIPVLRLVWTGARTNLHGRGFWVRPLVVEVMTGLLLAGLYWWETDELGLLTPALAATLSTYAGQAAISSHDRLLGTCAILSRMPSCCCSCSSRR